MFKGFNEDVDFSDLVFTNENFKPMYLSFSVMNKTCEHKSVLIKTMMNNAQRWQTGLKRIREVVQRFFEVRRLNQWRTLSIS